MSGTTKKTRKIGASTVLASPKPRKSSTTKFSRGKIFMNPKSDISQSELPKQERLPSSSPKDKETSDSSLREKLLRPNADGIVRISVDDLRRLPPGKTDWDALDRLTDEDIARAVAGDPDAAPIDLDWSKAKLYFPQGKQPMSLRIDTDVFAFFKGQGRGYQTRINAVLRAYMDHELAKTRDG